MEQNNRPILPRAISKKVSVAMASYHMQKKLQQNISSSKITK
jgi:hypothetical protein